MSPETAPLPAGISVAGESPHGLPGTLTHGRPSQYRPDIDGLRALAVLAVLFFHADLGLTGGYVGVDVFFVISGYLITGLILKDLERGTFSLLQFWERRIRRIAPALAVVVVATIIAGWFLFLPSDFESLGRSVVAQALLVSNVYFWRDSGYFAQASELKPLLHTWSLAVEEQFYLLFPIVLSVLRRVSRKSLVLAILVLFGVSFGLSVYCSYHRPLMNFYLLPTRAWELLVGSFLAVLPVRRGSARWLAESLCCAGVLAILFAMFMYDDKTRFPGVTAALPCVGAALIIWANGGTLTILGRLLAAPPIVFIGLISYSLYLWHWPVFVFSKYSSLTGPLSQTQRILLVVVSLLLGAASWKLIETPFRKGLVLKNRRRCFAFAGLTTVLFSITGFCIARLDGVPSRLPAEALQYAGGETDHAFRHELSSKDIRNEQFVELGESGTQQPIRVLVWGDSHAMAAMPVLDLLCKEHSVRGVAATHSGTIPLIGFDVPWPAYVKECNAFNAAVIEFNRARRIGDVILVARWANYVTDDDSLTRLRQGLFETIAALKDSGSRIWIMKTVPRQRGNVPRALVSAVRHGRDPQELGVSLAEHRAESALGDRIFEGVAGPGVTVLDPTDVFVGANQLCRMALDGKALYWDRSHLTVAGAMLLRPVFERVFEGIGNRLAPSADDAGN